MYGNSKQYHRVRVSLWELLVFILFWNFDYRFSFLMIKKLKDLKSVTVIGTRKFFNQ